MLTLVFTVSLTNCALTVRVSLAYSRHCVLDPSARSTTRLCPDYFRVMGVRSKPLCRGTRCRRTARAAPSGRPGAAGGTEAGRDGSGAQLRHVSGSSGHIGRPPGWMMETFTQVGRRPAGSPKMHRAAASYVCPPVRIYKQYFVRLRMTRAHALRIVELTAARPCSAIGEADNIMLEQRWPEQQEALRRVQKSAPSGCRPTRSPQILRRMTRRVARQHPRGDRWGSVCREREYGSLNA
jgi:hypothetical protein